MPYRSSSYNRYGNPYICDRGTLWWPQGYSSDPSPPGGNDYVRNAITNAYRSLFGRYGEVGGVEGYLGTWVYHPTRGGFSSIYAMVRSGGISSGELGNVNRYGRHTNLRTGSSCPPPPVPGCTNPQAANYNPSATVDNGTCYFTPPSVVLSVSPLTIIRGETSTISWSTSNSYYRVINQFGAVGTSGSRAVSPAGTTSYVLTANGLGGTRAITKTLIVYIPPVVTLSLDDSTITLGQSTVLRWSTTGDASTNTIQPGIGSTNLSSFQVVSPTVTTTYTATASGLGGVDSDEITLTVLQPPVIDLTVPLNVSYGNSLELGYTSINATVSLKIVPYYYSLDGVETIGADVVLPTGDESSGSITHTPAWDNRGPARIEYKLLAEGVASLTSEDVEIVPTIIDRLPDSIIVPESDELIKDQAPVITPDIQLTTEELLVTDIDIPVEIKSDSPIQVQIDNDGVWVDVENI